MSITSLTELQAAQRQAEAKVRGDVDAIRREIGSRQKQLRELAAAPPTVADIQQRADEMVAILAKAARTRGAVLDGASRRPEHFEADAFATSFGALSGIDLFALILPNDLARLIVREAVQTVVLAEAPSVPLAGRDERAARLRSELVAFQDQELDGIAAAARAGVVIDPLPGTTAAARSEAA